MNQISSLWKRRTSATLQRSNNSPSVRESRHAAANALGRVRRALEGVKAMANNTNTAGLRGAGPRLPLGIIVGLPADT